MKKFFDWIELKLEYLWNRAEKAVENDDRSLSIVRILYGLFILVFLKLDFAWIGDIPQGFFSPRFLSLSILFQGFPSYFVMRAIEIILMLLGLFILLGIKSRWTGIGFVITYVIANSFHFSFGKISHGSIMFITFILGLSFTNWGVNNAIVPDRQVTAKTQKRVLAILAVVLCFGMFTAGWEKALNWFDFNLETGGFMSWFYKGYFTQGRDDFLAPLILKIPPKLFELADYSAVIFELIPIFALLAGRKWWLVWLSIACVFHLANTLLLNINFISHAPVYLTFASLNFGSIGKQQKDLIHSQKLMAFVSGMGFFITLHYLINFGLNRPIISPLTYVTNLWGDGDLAKLYFSLIIWVLSVLVITLNLLPWFSPAQKA